MTGRRVDEGAPMKRMSSNAARRRCPDQLGHPGRRPGADAPGAARPIVGMDDDSPLGPRGLFGQIDTSTVKIL
jgi:hypothetical protein